MRDIIKLIIDTSVVIYVANLVFNNISNTVTELISVSTPISIILSLFFTFGTMSLLFRGLGALGVAVFLTSWEEKFKN